MEKASMDSNAERATAEIVEKINKGLAGPYAEKAHVSNNHHRPFRYTRQLVVVAVDMPDFEKGGGAYHQYEITHTPSVSSPVTVLGSINFQHGPIKEVGVNGIDEESLYAILIDRLEAFQSGPFACFENQMTLDLLRQALHWQQKRTVDRISRGVEGHNKE